MLGGEPSERQASQPLRHVADLVPVGLRRCRFEFGLDVLVPQIENIAEGEVAGLELVVGVGKFDDEARELNLCFVLGCAYGAPLVPASAGGSITAPIDDQAPVAGPRRSR